MKKGFILLLSLAVIGIFTGCDLNIKLTFENVKGEWLFPDIDTIKGTAVKNVGLSVMGDSENDVMLDIRWTTVDTDTYYLYNSNGSFEGNVFTGLYYLSSDMGTTFDISVEFTGDGETGTATFSGEGVLDGLVFEKGNVTKTD